MNRFDMTCLGPMVVAAILMLTCFEEIAPTHANAKEALLLRTGAVIEGEIQQDLQTDSSNGAGWTVIRGESREVRIRTQEILTSASSLSGLYRWQRSHFISRNSTAADHLRLADWCLRYRLWPEASRELLDAKQLAPQSGRLALLERRLYQLSSSPPSRSIRPNEMAQNKQTDHNPTGQKRAGQIGAEKTYPVQTASYEQTPQSSLSRNKGSASSGEAEAEIEIELSSEQLTHFTRKIQPLLVNNCTDSGCHRQQQTEDFSLDVSMLHGYGDARSTQHNLRKVLSTIDTKEPSKSPLLNAARGPHAGITPFFGPRREAWLKRLEDWVTEVSGVSGQGMVANHHLKLASAETSSRNSAQRQHYQSQSNQPVQAVGYETEPDRSASASATTATASTDREILETEYLEPAAAPRIGGKLKQVAPRDEFDPEIFNRKYRRPEDDLLL